jgi:hypothetical protein
MGAIRAQPRFYSDARSPRARNWHLARMRDQRVRVRACVTWSFAHQSRPGLWTVDARGGRAEHGREAPSPRAPVAGAANTPVRHLHCLAFGCDGRSARCWNAPRQRLGRRRAADPIRGGSSEHEGGSGRLLRREAVGECGKSGNLGCARFSGAFPGLSDFRLWSGGVGDPVAVELQEVVGRGDQPPF